MSGKLAAETAPPSVSAVPEPKTGNNCSIVANIKASDKRGKAPITTYTLSNKLLLDKIGNDRKSGGKLIGGRSGMAYTPASRSAVFRSDMADVVLKMMRQTLVDSLVERSAASVRHQSSCGQIVPIGSWEDAKQVKERGSLLFLQADDAKSPDAGVDKVVPSFEYATLDVDNTSYDRKMPVYDLIRLLGKDEVARLRASAPATFSQNESQGRSVQRKYVLKRKSSHSSINLHLLLWRLEGYLAENRAPAPAA